MHVSSPGPKGGERKYGPSLAVPWGALRSQSNLGQGGAFQGYYSIVASQAGMHSARAGMGSGVSLGAPQPAGMGSGVSLGAPQP